MNYDEPRQISSGDNAGKWRYTSMNDGQVWAIGYCANGCPGHDTKDEAREHYRQWQLDTKLQFHDGPADPDTLRRCEADGCTEHTAGSASMGPWLSWTLCPAHRTRETVEALYPTAGDSIHS
jgi:hypothetical protein